MRGGTSESSSNAGSSNIGNTEEPDVNELLNKFMAPRADYAALTSQLRPTERDYQAFFVEDKWKIAMQKYNNLWDNYPLAIGPEPGQTEILVWHASWNDLKNQTGDAAKFPEQYRQIIHFLNPGHTFYFFKFAQPGTINGVEIDGLVYLNRHWVLFPKPWNVLN